VNKIEVMLGVAVFLLSALSILFINSGVIPSSQFPGHYTYSFLAGLPRVLLILLPLVGFAAICQAIYKKRLLEFALGIVVIVWGFFAWLSISIILIDGAMPYIKGSLIDDLIETSLSIIPGIFLGIALTLDGILGKMRLLSKRNY